MAFAPSSFFSAYKAPPALRRNPWAPPSADPSAPPAALEAPRTETGLGTGMSTSSADMAVTAAVAVADDGARTAAQNKAESSRPSPDDGPAAYAARALTSMIDASHSVRDQAIAVVMRENHCTAREARHALQTAAAQNQLEVSDVAAAVLALAAGQESERRVS